MQAALAGREVRARGRRVVGARPATQQDLQRQHGKRCRGERPHAAFGGPGRSRLWGQRQPPQQRQRGQATRQVQRHDRRCHQLGHRERTEQALQPDHDEQHERQHARLAAQPAVPDRQGGEPDDDQAERRRRVAMDHLAQRLAIVELMRRVRGVDGRGIGDGGRVQMPVAARPVGATQSRGREPDPGAHDDDDERECRAQSGEPAKPEQAVSSSHDDRSIPSGPPWGPSLPVAPAAAVQPMCEYLSRRFMSSSSPLRTSPGG